VSDSPIARRRRMLPDLSIVTALLVALTVSGATLFWVQQRISAIEARLDRELRVADAVRALPLSPTTTTTASTGAGATATATPAAWPLARFTSMDGTGTTLEAALVYVQRVDGKAAASVAAQYGDAPTDGAYIIDTGERTATMTVAVRVPVVITVNPVPSASPPADAAALAAALRGAKGAVWKRCYFLIRRDGLYITSIRQADAPLRAR
jgi:cytoskeletal protein RodZ